MESSRQVSCPSISEFQYLLIPRAQFQFPILFDVAPERTPSMMVHFESGQTKD
jgi:hypothetical protein